MTSVKYLPTYKTRGDEISPCPPANMVEAARIGHIAWKKAKSNAVNLSEKFSKCLEGFENLSNTFEHFETFSLERRGIGVGDGVGIGVGEKPIAPSKLDAEAPQQNIFIELPTLQHPFAVSDRDLDSWGELYPAVDVRQAVRNMRGWLESSPRKRKSHQGMSRFVHTWLRGDQDKGGTGGTSKGSAGGDNVRGAAVGRVERSLGAWDIAAQRRRVRLAECADETNAGLLPPPGIRAGDGGGISVRHGTAGGEVRPGSSAAGALRPTPASGPEVLSPSRAGS